MGLNLLEFYLSLNPNFMPKMVGSWCNLSVSFRVRKPRELRQAQKVAWIVCDTML